MARGKQALNNAVLLAHSQSGSSSTATDLEKSANQIVLKGAGSGSTPAGTVEEKDDFITFNIAGEPYTFNLSNFATRLDKLQPFLALPINKLTGEAIADFKTVNTAVDQIKTHGAPHYAQVIQIVRRKYGLLHGSNTPGTLYNYFMGCAKTGDVCSPTCAGGISHDGHNCTEPVLIKEEDETLRPLNHMKKSRHAFIYVDPSKFKPFRELHVRSLKEFDVEEVTVLTKCQESASTFQQQRIAVEQLVNYRCPCAPLQGNSQHEDDPGKTPHKPKNPGQKDPGHEHPGEPGHDHPTDPGHDHPGEPGEPEHSKGWLWFWIIVGIVVLILLICAIVYAYNSSSSGSWGWSSASASVTS